MEGPHMDTGSSPVTNCTQAVKIVGTALGFFRMGLKPALFTEKACLPPGFQAHHFLTMEIMTKFLHLASFMLFQNAMVLSL